MPIIKTNKTEILQHCWEVFNREGYYNTSLQMLAEASGLGKSGVLHHFGSKEGLMHAVLEFSIEAFQAYVLAPATEDLPPDQRLEKLLRRQNRLAKRDRRGCFYANVGLETGREGLFNAAVQQVFELWVQTVSQIMEAAYSKDDAKQAAYETLLQYEGAVLFYKLTGDESHLENMVSRVIEAFRKALIK